MSRATICVLGAGSYGTCLAILLAEAGHAVTMWCRSSTLAAQMTQTRVNDAYLPGHRLPAAVTITSDVDAAVRDADFILGVTPSHAVRDVLGRASQSFRDDVVIVNASKGLEEGSMKRMDEVYADIFTPSIASRALYLSGPTFAKEIAKGQPAAIVLAGRDAESLARAQARLSNPIFRIYRSNDVVGVLLGGALKNIVAIAAGVSDGLGHGLNARAALITRGLAEIARLGVKCGAEPMTFSGLSGMGDLVLTCSGDLSRNRQVGLALGRGQGLDEIVADMRMVAEGVKTTKVAHNLATQHDVDMPVTRMMYEILFGGLTAKDAVGALMRRPLRSEQD